MNDSATNDYWTPILSKRPGVQGGLWCIEGTRIRRCDVRAYVRIVGRARLEQEVYPWLTTEQIDMALTRWFR